MKKFSKIKYFKIVLLIVLICFKTTTFADNNKKLYLIENPENGVQRIVNEDGVTVAKTETGLKKDDYNELKRQEELKIKYLDGGYEIAYKESHGDNSKCYLYDSDGTLIDSDEGNSLEYSVVKYKDGKIVYPKDTDIYNYEINAKTTKLIGGSLNGGVQKAPNEQLTNDLNMEEKVDAFNKKNVIITNSNNISPDQLITSSEKKDENKVNTKTGNMSINELYATLSKTYLDEFETEYIQVKKYGDKYKFISKKYGFEIDDIKYYTEYHKSANCKIYKIASRNFISFVNENGRLLAEDYSYSDSEYENNYPFIYAKFGFVDDNIIIFHCDDKSYNPIFVVYRYSDVPLIYNWEFHEDYENDKIYYMVFGEKIYETSKVYYWEKTNLDNKDYLKLNTESGKIIIDMDGKEIKDILANHHFNLLKKNNKYYLYNESGTLVRTDIDSFELYDFLYTHNVYSTLDKCCIVKVNNKYEIVDQNGNTLVAGLDSKSINFKIDDKRFASKEEEFLTTKVNNKINLYDRDCSLLLSNLDSYEVWRSGNYFVASKDGEIALYTIKGKKMFNIEETKNILEIYGHGNKYNADFDRVLKLKHIRFCDINGDLCVLKNGRFDLYDLDGNVLLENYKFLKRYDDEYLIYEKGFNYGLIDRNGNVKFKFSIFDGTNYDE